MFTLQYTVQSPSSENCKQSFAAEYDCEPSQGASLLLKITVLLEYIFDYKWMFSQKLGT